MKKYYLYNGREQQGPFSIEEINQFNILPDTFIWYEGMATWTQARDVPELNKIIINLPPLPSSANNIGQQQPSPATNSHWAKKYQLLLIVTIIIAILAIAFVYQFPSPDNVEQPAETTTEESLIADTAVVLPQSAMEPPSLSMEEEAKMAEENSPGKYLTINTTLEKNLLLQPLIKGTLFNRALTTTYDNIRLRITYTGQDGSLIGEEDIVIEGSLQPKELVEIRHKPAKRAYRKAKEYKVTLNTAHAAR